MKVMIINTGWEQEDLVNKAQELGHQVLSVMGDPRDIERLLKIARNENIDGIASDQCDYSYYAAAYISDVLGLPGVGLTVAQNCTNKKWMREACAVSGIKQPAFSACKHLHEVYGFIREVGYPVIIKPVDNRGGFGVTKIENPGHVVAAFYEAIMNAHSRECIVEQYVDGTMAVVEGFAYNKHVSLVTGSKTMLDGRKRVAMELVYPAEFDLSEINNRVVGSLGVTFGATHTEYIVNDDGVYFIECANRGGGCLISSRIVPAVSGFDVSGGLIRLALGESVTIQKQEKAAVVLSFFGFPPGKMKKYEVKDNPDILAFKMFVEAGAEIEPITNAANRHGFIIAKGDDKKRALQLVETVKGGWGI